MSESDQEPVPATDRVSDAVATYVHAVVASNTPDDTTTTSSGVTEADVQAMIDTAIADVQASDSDLTQEDVQAEIDAALSDVAWQLQANRTTTNTEPQ